jgi:hypothetical protein
MFLNKVPFPIFQKTLAIYFWIVPVARTGGRDYPK